MLPADGSMETLLISPWTEAIYESRLADSSTGLSSTSISLNTDSLAGSQR